MEGLAFADRPIHPLDNRVKGFRPMTVRGQEAADDADSVLQNRVALGVDLATDTIRKDNQNPKNIGHTLLTLTRY